MQTTCNNCEHHHACKVCPVSGAFCIKYKCVHFVACRACFGGTNQHKLVECSNCNNMLSDTCDTCVDKLKFNPIPNQNER